MLSVKVRAAALAVLAVLLAASSASAADFTWTGPDNGTWSTAANWDGGGGSAPSGTVGTLAFAQSRALR
jgi:hypothetical protein